MPLPLGFVSVVVRVVVEVVVVAVVEQFSEPYRTVQ